ncbi:hypothetical protein HYW53_02310 [Candidatus Giovannonibacteria bacterium]|nr:hypothetical protein [Candidatus Giovannonibacteria bacterium]
MAVFVVLAAILIAEAVFLLDIFFAFPKSNFIAAVLPSVLVDLTNESRAQENMMPLQTNSLLEKAAKLKAEDMAKRGYFSHVAPDGKSPWHFFDEVGYLYQGAGENLAVNFFDSSDVARAWMNSTGHRANILNKQFKEIGISTAEGVYEGRVAVFVVQFFGTPAIANSGFRATGTAGTTPDIKITEAENKMSIALAVSQENAETTSVLSVSNEKAAASVGEKIFSAPRMALNYVFGALGIIVMLALMLKIFVKIKIQHPVLIANGVLLIITMLGFAAANDYLNFLFTKII